MTVKATRVLALMLVILAGAYALAADTPNHGVGQTRTLALFEKAKVGNTVLPAGSYTVTHLMDGSNHVLVFKNGKNEVARVNCTMVELPKKADRTQQEYKTNGEVRVLSAVTFGGDKFKHQF